MEKGAVMQGQSERGGPLEIRSKIWIERRGRGDVVLSEWRVELLEAIDAHGSLSRAAEALDVPYRTAWERVKATEGEIGFRLLDSESGGLEGAAVASHRRLAISVVASAGSPAASRKSSAAVSPPSLGMAAKGCRACHRAT